MMPKQQLWAAMVGKEFEEAGVGKVGRRWKLSPFRGRHTYIHSYIHTYLTARLMRDLFEGAGYFTLLEFIVHQLLSNKTSSERQARQGIFLSCPPPPQSPLIFLFFSQYSWRRIQ